MLLFITLLCIQMIAFAVYRLVEIGNNFDISTVFCAISIAFGGLFGFLMGSMVISILLDVVDGVTTNERIRKRWQNEKNPFDLGWESNCNQFFYQKIEPNIMEIEKTERQLYLSQIQVK